MKLNAGRVLDIPLIVTEQNPEKLGKTISEFDTSSAIGIFPKTRFSMITPEVTNILKNSHDIDSVVLFGLETHICVEQTAMDLLAMEKYSVHIVADAVLSRTFGDRKMALHRLREMGCIITTSENVIFKLIKDKNHEKFNEVRNLISKPSVFPGIGSKL